MSMYRIRWIIAVGALGIAHFVLAETEPATANTKDAAKTILTNTCETVPMGNKGFALAVCGGMKETIIEVLTPTLAANPILNSNVTLRVEVQGTVKIAYSETAGKYVMSMDGGTTQCQLTDNVTSNTVRTFVVPAPREFYREDWDQWALAVVKSANP